MKNKCPKCLGFGFWPIGQLVPIGEMDAVEWKENVIQCPYCLAGFIKTGKRYALLKKLKGEK